MFGWMPVCNEYIKQRKITQLAFTRKNIEKYKTAQDEEVSILLQSLLDDPDNLDRHLHR